jgi:hypothetical protein
MTLTEMLKIYKLIVIVELSKYDINYKSGFSQFPPPLKLNATIELKYY